MDVVGIVIDLGLKFVRLLLVVVAYQRSKLSPASEKLPFAFKSNHALT